MVAILHKPEGDHIDQKDLKALVVIGQKQKAFEAAFETGNDLFDTTFNALDGVGANVGQGQRFTRIPRADLKAPGEWATHIPFRATGPNAQSCTSCHSQSGDDGSGSATNS